MPAGLSARLALGLVIALCGPVTGASAEPIVATLQAKDAQAGRTTIGALRFDLGSGPLRGTVEMAAPADPSSLPRFQQGGNAGGRFTVRIELTGTYPGGSYGSVAGAATVSGTFATDRGCQARVGGTGTMDGTVSAPTGLIQVTATFPAMQFEGCGLASPQGFAAALPAFVFAATDVPPTPTGAVTLQRPITAPVRQATAPLPPAVVRATPGAAEGDALGRGFALLRAERFREALQAFDEALQRSVVVEALLGRGQTRSLLGDTAGALQDLGMALRERPAVPEARVWMAELWLASGDYERAQQALGDELQLVPDSALARSYLGTLQLLTHRMAEARETMKDVARRDPAAARTRYGRGVVLTAQRQPRRAAIEFTSALAFEPPIKAAYFGLGLAMAELGQHADAIRMFEHYIALEPSTPLATRARQEIERLKAHRPS